VITGPLSWKEPWWSRPELVAPTRPWTSWPWMASWRARREQFCATIDTRARSQRRARVRRDRIQLHGQGHDHAAQQFSSVVDDKEMQILLWVCGGTMGVYTAYVFFDCSHTMYLASGWRRFCRVHQIRVGHFLIFNYDGEHTLTVTAFDKTICHRHYPPVALANTVDSWHGCTPNQHVVYLPRPSHHHRSPTTINNALPHV
jgi:hypothetical protein